MIALVAMYSGVELPNVQFQRIKGIGNLSPLGLEVAKTEGKVIESIAVEIWKVYQSGLLSDSGADWLTYDNDACPSCAPARARRSSSGDGSPMDLILADTAFMACISFIWYPTRLSAMVAS